MYKSYLTLFYTLLICMPGFSQVQTPQYQIASQIPVEGNGGWDYLTMDEASGHLFISHSTVVQVLDVKTNKVIAIIPDTKGVHGVTIAQDLGKGYISDGKDNAVTVFDLSSFKTLNKIAVAGKNPDAILYDPFSHRVFAFNGRSNNATVIDAKNDSVIATIPLAGKPEFAATDLDGKIYLNIEDASLLSVINTATLKVENSWPIAPGKEASGLAIDNKHHRLFMVCDNNLMVIMNALTGAVIASLPIGDGADGVSFDTGSERAFSSNGDGTMTVVGEKDNKYQVIENVKTHKGARTIAVNSLTHHLYLPCADFGKAPEATSENPKPRPSIQEGSFTILDITPTAK